MRINKLKLTRYGSFTDRVIDFGEQAANGESPSPDLHIVFGPNEAGKSTLRSAVIDFMYGFERQSRYAFLHQNNALQLEANVSAGTRRFDLMRVKRASNSLLDASGDPVGDDLLLPLLGQVSRESYISMFSLDEDLLEEGGESILASKGDLSELLFSSAAGLSALSVELASIRAETEQFFKPRGRTLRLNEMNKELKSLKRRIKELDVPAAAYDSLRKAERLTHKTYTEAVAERDENQAVQRRTKAILDSASPWREFLDIDASLKASEVLPTVPSGWYDEAQKLSDEASRLTAVIGQLEQNETDLKASIAAIDVSPKLLELALDIDRLSTDGIEAKVRAAVDDGSSEVALTALQEQIDQHVRRLGAPIDSEYESLLLPVARVGDIRALIARFSAVEASLRTAGDEVIRAEAMVEQARAAVEEADEVVDRSELAALVSALKMEGRDASRVDRLRLHRQLEDQNLVVDSALLSLEPWRGDVDELEALVVPPPERFEELEKRRQSIAEKEAALHAQEASVAAELTRVLTERDTLKAGGELIDDARAEDSRKIREAAWHAHTDTLAKHPVDPAALASSADRFVTALGDDDVVVDTRFRQAREIALLRELELNAERMLSEQQELEQRMSALDAEKEALHAELTATCETLDLPVSFGPQALLRWSSARSLALQEGNKQKRLLAECRSADEDEKRAMAMLDAALGVTPASSSAGGESLALAIQTAEQSIADWQEQKLADKERRSLLEDRSAELSLRRQALTQMQTAMDDWTSSWANALSELWPAADGRLPSIPEMNEILSSLDALEGLLDKRRDLRTTQQTLAENRATYSAEVARLASLAELDMDAADPLGVADALRVQLAGAREDQRRLEEKVSQLDEIQEKFVSARAQNEVVNATFARMKERFPADSTSALLDALRVSEDQARTLEQCKRLERQLIDTLAVASFDDAKAMLTEQLPDSQSLETLRQKHSHASGMAQDLDEQVSQTYHAWKAAQGELKAVGDDAEVARLNEQVRVLLLDIESEARRYLSLSAGTLVVERALRTYLDGHRSTMLTRASDAFATITRGAFRGLDAMPGSIGKHSEELVGIRRDGSSISATQMSRGSRFQLYLSLRIAGYHEFVGQRDPLPFFADDILETFDDDRSAETFGLMADMAKHGQVIYLTHHRHLCDLALEVTGGQAQIHELPPRTLAAL